MSRIARFVIFAFVAILVGVLIFGAVRVAISSVEQKECVTWINYQITYPEFYWADWQIDQCESYGYDVDKWRK